jgi:tryptophan 2,3-dioxygenase
LENKLGVRSEHRVKYNQSNYREVYKGREEDLDLLQKSEEEPSLSEVIQR